MINVYSFTSAGPRVTNQDSILVFDIPNRGLLCCVADGVGGNQGGETASKMAVDIISQTLTQNPTLTLSEAIIIAHESILSIADKNESLSGMATTITAVIINDNTLELINCGDSRAYILRGNGLQQLSQDHSEVARLLKEGRLTPETAIDYPRKNILESALGAHKPLQLHEIKFNLELHDRVVLMSDGVSSVVNKKEFRDLSKKYINLNEFGTALTNYTETKGTNDNYSLIIAQIDY